MEYANADLDTPYKTIFVLKIAHNLVIGKMEPVSVGLNIRWIMEYVNYVRMDHMKSMENVFLYVDQINILIMPATHANVGQDMANIKEFVQHAPKIFSFIKIIV